MHNNPAISIISYDPDLFMLWLAPTTGQFSRRSRSSLRHYAGKTGSKATTLRIEGVNGLQRFVHWKCQTSLSKVCSKQHFRREILSLKMLISYTGPESKSYKRERAHYTGSTQTWTCCYRLQSIINTSTRSIPESIPVHCNIKQPDTVFQMRTRQDISEIRDQYSSHTILTIALDQHCHNTQDRILVWHN